MHDLFVMSLLFIDNNRNEIINYEVPGCLFIT